MMKPDTAKYLLFFNDKAIPTKNESTLTVSAVKAKNVQFISKSARISYDFSKKTVTNNFLSYIFNK